MARRFKTTTEWHRRDAVASWRASGLNQAEFCRREGIPEWRLSEWKRREVQASGKESKPAERKMSRSRPNGIEFAAAGEHIDPSTLEHISIPKVSPFIPLVPQLPTASLKAARAKGKPDPVVAEIEFDEMVLRVFSGADQETLRAILQALQECSRC